MAFRRGRPGRTFPVKRSGTNWARGVFAGTPLTLLPGTKSLAGSVTLSNPGIGEVVRRTRGVFAVISDQGSALEQQVGALGFIVVTDTALAQGIASLPSPASQRNDDGWFVWESFCQVGNTLLAGSPVSSSQTSPQVYSFDSKAMRKVEEGYSIAVVVENFGPDGLRFMFNFSLLSSRIG